MNIRVMPVGGLSGEQVRSVLVQATYAPSRYDSRPWRLRCSPTAISLYADAARALPVADPDHRELLLACGAALLNLRVATRALGVYPAVQPFPDADQPDLLAVVRPQGYSEATPVDRRLAAAIGRHRTGRAAVTSRTVPVPVLNGLRQAAKIEQAWIATLSPAQLPALRTLAGQARDVQRNDPAFVAERSHRNGREKGPADEAPPDGGPLTAVIGSFNDLPLARLQAGQAMQRVVLTATVAELSTAFVSDVVEVPTTRRQLRGLIGGGLWPQIVLRLGSRRAG